MRGLLIKDFLLLFQRKQTLLMFLLISLVMGFSIGGSFIVGYMCLLSTTLAVGTISYDDADNGLLFLLTCPVSRREYVLSKYMLCGIVLAASWIVAVVFLFVLNLVQGIQFRFLEDLVAAVVFIPGIVLTYCLMIPVQLKYGPEKGRLVIMLFGGGLVALIFLLVKGFDMEKVVQMMDSVPDVLYVAAGIVFCILALLVSFGICTRVMENKKL